MQTERLERLQQLVNRTLGQYTDNQCIDIALKETQLRVEPFTSQKFPSQKPFRQRAAPYFAKAERCYNKAEEALAEEKDALARRRFEVANKYYARGFKNLYSELLTEEDYWVLRRIIKHYGTSLELSNKELQAVDELRRIGRFLLNRNRWWEANRVLDETVEIIEADNLPTNGKEQQYLNLAEIMARGNALQTILEDLKDDEERLITRHYLIEFAKQEGLLEGIAHV